MIPQYIDLDLEKECGWYEPCPICKRCMAVADHLYDRCHRCLFAYHRCRHTEAQRIFAIRRKNFRIHAPGRP